LVLWTNRLPRITILSDCNIFRLASLCNRYIQNSGHARSEALTAVRLPGIYVHYLHVIVAKFESLFTDDDDIKYNRAAKGWAIWMRMKRFANLAIAVILGSANGAQAAPEPVNVHATPEARALLAYLDSISAQATITGQHNFPNDASRWTDLAYDLTANYPGLFGQDFGFSAGDDKDSVLSRPAMIEEVQRQYRNGAVIALTWHAVKPTEDEPVTFRDSVQGHLSDYEWHQLLTPGSPLYNRWCDQVDVIAGYLRQLREAHVPVLFRPYHEVNGNWFWWGGRPNRDGSAALYRQIYDRFVNVHHLDNLVWVWNVNSPGGNAGPIVDYYPGPQFADVVTMDIYGEFKQEYYDSMVALAGGKPIALAEVGALPSPEVLDSQPRWTYFMAWSGLLESSNSLDRINAVYHAPRMLNRDNPRLAGPMEAIRRATADRSGTGSVPAPVSPHATVEATTLLSRLLAAPGQAVLSGQENDPASPSAATAAVMLATGKQPAIFSTDLESPQTGSALVEARKVVVKEAIRAHLNHAEVSLNWRESRPTDDAPASEHGQLSDFEWNELLTPGTSLNKRWCERVDELAATLRELEQAGVAVLWNPYPESNGKDNWWAGRKGIHGSAALYRQLFNRLVNRDGLHNLIWVWEAAAPDFRPGGAGIVSDFFPGLLYTDALEIRLSRIDSRFPASRFLNEAAVGKVIGVELNGDIPPPELLTQHSVWAWFLVVPPPSAPSDPTVRSEALRTLYGDPQIVSLAAKH
jgi:mannan endo-1,4-beta-mannosidase